MRTTVIHFNGDNDNKLNFLHHYANCNGTNAAERKRMWTILTKAIEGELTDLQKHCLVEKYIGNKKQKDIAAELGVNSSTVSRHINAAERKLKNIAGYYS